MASASTCFNLKPHITPNSFLTCTDTSGAVNPKTTTLIYFIPGNPGLITYYHLFFSLLSSNLSSKGSNRKTSYIIRGRSLGGFEVPEEENQLQDAQPIHLYGLKGEIAFMERDLEEFARAWQASTGVDGAGTPRARVVIMGHSVGAYIAMEILRRRRERSGAQQKRANGAVGPATSEREVGSSLDIVGGIMLFPTVLDIAKSPNGRVLTKLLYIPYFPLLVSMLARFLVYVLPTLVLYRVVSKVMGNPRKEAVETTVSMLRNAHIVREALHMSADEMREISADKWSDELWGITGPPNSVEDKLTKMVFYFGRNDHWVAETTREEIIRSKANFKRSDSGPVMTVCEDGVVHGFCIGHNEIMAQKVGQFIRDIEDD